MNCIQNPGILHVGFMKTGSTFLQREIFPKLNVFYAESWSKFISDTLFLNVSFSKSVDLIMSHIQAEASQLPNDLPIVISSEIFLGDPQLGMNNFEKRAKVLKAVFPNFSVLAIIRKQDDYYESLYMQTIHNYKWGKVDNFLSIVNGEFQPFNYRSLILEFHPKVSILDGNWHEKIKILSEIFNKNQLEIYAYEAFFNTEDAINQLFKKHFNLTPPPFKLSKKINRRYSWLSYRVALILNRFVRTPTNPHGLIVNRPFTKKMLEKKSFHKHISSKLFYAIFSRLDLRRCLQKYVDQTFKLKQAKPFDISLREKILSHHKASNKLLAEEYDLDLNKYGYY